MVINEFEKRFREILNAMDEALENAQADEETLDQLAELNAETEDALMLFEAIESEDEAAAEELEDAVDEFMALCQDYEKLAKAIPDIAPQVQRLNMVVAMMKNNL